jgi:hypothetical protein
MKKGALAFGLFSLGAYSWWESRVPPERIVRVVPSEKWTDLNGYPEDEFIAPVSRNLRMVGDGPPYGNLRQKDGLVKRLTFYEKHGARFLLLSEHDNLSLDEAEKKIAESHQRKMAQTTAFHQMILERIE